jgi:hypothetical protein
VRRLTAVVVRLTKRRVASIVCKDTHDTAQIATRRRRSITSMPNNDFITSEPTVKLRITYDNADSWLQYETRYKVLICRHHHYAISNLGNHLRTEHSGTTKEKAAVARKYSHLDILQPTQVQLPPPLEPPI